MLTIDKVTISIQDLGSVYYVFLSGSTKEAREQRFFSFWNNGATSGELQELTDNIDYFVVHSGPEEKMIYALQRAAFNRFCQGGKTKGLDALPLSSYVGALQFKRIDKVNWIKIVRPSLDLYSMGDSVKAEKEVGDFSDVLRSQVQRAASHEGFNVNDDIEEEA